jgi:hypothetical protein
MIQVADTLLAPRRVIGRALPALLLVTACGGSAPGAPGTAEPLAETCRVTLAPRSSPFAAEPAATPGPGSREHTSQIVAHVAMKLGPLKKELEASVPGRIADERGRSIGVGGHVNVTADRGPFALTVEGDALVVRTDVTVRADACARGRCYASCDPVVQATATVPLRLLPTYRFAPSKVTATFSRGCQIRVLGGIVRVDVTPMLEAQIRPQLRRIEQEIDRKLPPVRPQAERLWQELSETRPLPLGGCVVLDPRAVAQGPVSGTAEVLRIRFGLTAAPELRTRCGEPPRARPLPPLTQDRALPPDGDIELGLVTPIAALASGAENAPPFDVGGARARVARATAAPAGAGARLDLGLRGEACGDAAARVLVAWADDGATLRLASVEAEPGDRERLVAAGLEPGALSRGLESNVRIEPPLAPEALKELLPTLASGLSDPRAEVSVVIKDVAPSTAAVRGGDLVAWARLRGRIEIREK